LPQARADADSIHSELVSYGATPKGGSTQEHFDAYLASPKYPSWVPLRNSSAKNKLEPSYKGPLRLLPLRQGQSEATRDVKDTVNDKVTTVHINNLVPIALPDADATNVARISAGEHLVTAVTGHSGSPSTPGTLLFNLQFDNQTTNYPTRFRNCKFVALVRDYIKDIIRVTPNSPFRILIPQLREDAPQRTRKANRQLSDYDQSA
jgi:hypothetical protein